MHRQIHIHTLETFRASCNKIEKCSKLSWWVNIIFSTELLVALHLQLFCFMCSNNSFALGLKSMKHREEQAILKKLPLIAEWKIFCGIFSFYIEINLFYQTICIETLLDGYIQIKKCSMINLVFNPKLKFLWKYITKKTIRFLYYQRTSM